MGAPMLNGDGSSGSKQLVSAAARPELASKLAGWQMGITALQVMGKG